MKKIIKKKQKTGRKAFIFDEKVLKKIEELAMNGHTNDAIAACIGIDRATFYRKKKSKSDFCDTIQRGRAKAEAKVGNKLMDLCLKGNLNAIIWYEKTRCGRSEKIDVNNTGTVSHKHVGLSRVDQILAEFQNAGRKDRDDETLMPN